MSDHTRLDIEAKNISPENVDSTNENEVPSKDIPSV